MLAISCSKDDTPRQQPAPAAPSGAPSAAFSIDVRRESTATPSVSTIEPAPSGTTSAGAQKKVPLILDLPDPLPAPARRHALSAAKVFAGYGIPVYPTAQHLCARQGPMRGGGSRSSDAFASSDTISKVVAFYKTRLSSKGFGAQPRSGWDLPGGRRLEVVRPSDPGIHTLCESKPPASAQSVLLLSVAR